MVHVEYGTDKADIPIELAHKLTPLGQSKTLAGYPGHSAPAPVVATGSAGTLEAAGDNDKAYDVFPSFRFSSTNEHRKNLIKKLISRRPDIKVFDPKDAVRLDKIPDFVKASKTMVILGSEDYGKDTVDSSGYNTYNELTTGIDFESQGGPEIILAKMFLADTFKEPAAQVRLRSRHYVKWSISDLEPPDELIERILSAVDKRSS